MNLTSTASVALTLAAALALSACDTAPQQGNREAAAQSAANAALAQREAQAQAEKAEAERKQQIAEANTRAKAARFVPQSYATWADGSSNLALHFLKNGKVTWEEQTESGKPFTMAGAWRQQKGQLVVRLNNKQDKKTETFVFQPKVALIAPAAQSAQCQALMGLMPVSANGQTENLDKIYLWPKAQLEKNQGSCSNG